MAKLHHIRQLAVESETTAGTEVTTHSAADLIRVRDLTIQQSPQYFERPVHTESFGYTPRINNNSSCEISFAVEVAGINTNTGGSWTNQPVWSRLLEACGFKAVSVYDVDVGAITGGPFQHGEEIADDPDSATQQATCVGTYRTGVSKIYVEALSVGSSFTAGIEGATSGATATTSTEDGDAQAGYAWYPDTDSTDTVSIRIYNDGDLIRVYGCRGDVTIDCSSQDIAVLRFTMQGIYSTTSATSMLDSLENVAYREFTPPTFNNASLALQASAGSGDWASTDINFTEAQFTMGNNVVMRQNSNSASGWLAAHIANRTPSGSFNPDDPGVATYNLREKFDDNTRYQLDCSWGSTEGNTFAIHAPGVELDSVGDGERDEVQSLNLSFRMTRGFESGAGTNTVGNDNEFIIFNL